MPPLVAGTAQVVCSEPPPMAYTFTVCGRLGTQAATIVAAGADSGVVPVALLAVATNR